LQAGKNQQVVSNSSVRRDAGRANNFGIPNNFWRGINDEYKTSSYDGSADDSNHSIGLAAHWSEVQCFGIEDQCLACYFSKGY